MKPDLTVIILTFNEEENIARALRSTVGWAREVFVFDSFSTDRTLNICKQFDCKIALHKFENFGSQRNAALTQLPIKTEWILFLDADEWLPVEVRGEIDQVLGSSPKENGFYLKRRFIWMGRWIRRGYYPTWILRLFRYKKASCEDRTVNEHLIVEGSVGQLEHDFIHEDRKDISRWIAKHNDFATREASELLRIAEASNTIRLTFWGTQEQRKRWIRERIWNRLPPLLRPFLYFAYRYVLSGGFLDGREAFMYHVLQAFWFPLLIDVRYFEMKHRSNVEAEAAH